MNVSKRVQVSSNLLSVLLFYITEGPFFLGEHFYSCWSRKSFKQLRRTYWLLFESFCRKFWSLVFWSVSVTAYKARFLYVNEFFSFSNCFVIFTEWYWLLYELIIVLSFALKTWFDLYKMLFGHAWNIKKAATFGNILKMKQQQHDINLRRTRKKNPSPRWDLNPRPSVI